MQTGQLKDFVAGRPATNVVRCSVVGPVSPVRVLSNSFFGGGADAVSRDGDAHT